MEKKAFRHFSMRAAMLLLTLIFAFAGAQTAWAGSESDLAVNGNTYTINTAEGWNEFCDLLAGGTSFTGKTVKLGNDISVTRMAGSEGHEFTGTFDGDGHTLTVSYGSANQRISEQYAAPFRYAGGLYIDGKSYSCTIKNMRVAGTIYTSAKYAAGFVGFNNTNGYISLENCRSSVVINSSINGDGTHGGFVARRQGYYTLYIRGCVFDGEFRGSNTTSWGGFVGWRNSGSVYMYHSVFAPSAVEINKAESATFCRNGDNSCCYFRCYYTEDINDGTNFTGQGKRMRSITAGTDVTVGLVGYTTYYDVSDITNYGSIYSSEPGLKYGNTCYASSGEEVSITLSANRPGSIFYGSYTASNGGTLSGNATDGWTLTMPDANVTINGNWVDPNDISVNGTETEYTIKTTAGWGQFCDLLEGNDKGFFTDKTVKLANDISVTSMVGSEGHEFTGTFDGQGHTLNVHYNNIDNFDYNPAPFQYVEGGRIENLRVAGPIQTNNKYAAGFISQQYGNVTIRNCRSSVIISSHTNGDGTHGGFVAVNNNGTLTIEGCVFDGKIVSPSNIVTTTDCGGFVGWKNNSGTLTITNSLYAPQTDAKAVSSGATFARNWTMPADANCYYTRTLGTAQGKQAHTVTAGEHVTISAIALSGSTKTYDFTNITTYANGGLTRGGTKYYGSGDVVSLTLSNTTPEGYDVSAYTASAGTLSGSDNPYTLTMPDADVTIGATLVEWTYYTINDWDTFCNWIKNDYDNYKDKHYKLGADVSTTKMVGDVSHPFCGTFDGQGHTLTVSYSENSLFIAPFRYVSGTSSAPVVIKNLHIAGTITNQNRCIGGMVGKVLADGYVTIENCRSSVDIVSTYDGNDGRLSGIVSRGDDGATINIKGSVFDGSINAANGVRCAGFFVSWGSGVYVTIENCLFAPTAITVVGNDHKTFAPSKNLLTNCYYTQTLGGAQGEEGILLYDSGVPATANAGVISRCNGKQYKVQLLGRTLTKNNEWNTLCLPFTLTSEQIAASPLAGATIKGMFRSSSLDNNGTLKLYFADATRIWAGEPHIIKWDGDGTNNIVNPTFSNVTISSTTPTAVVSNDKKVTFVGQYSPFSIVESGATGSNQGNKNEILLMTKGNKIGYSKNPRTLNCFRCHFYVPTNGGQQAHSIEVDFGEGEATALSEELRVKSEECNATLRSLVEEVWYSLDGRKLEGKPTAKGMYIVNGRKVIIK